MSLIKAQVNSHEIMGSNHLINELLTTVVKSGRLPVRPPRGIHAWTSDLSTYLQER